MFLRQPLSSKFLSKLNLLGLTVYGDAKSNTCEGLTAVAATEVVLSHFTALALTMRPI